MVSSHTDEKSIKRWASSRYSSQAFLKLLLQGAGFPNSAGNNPAHGLTPLRNSKDSEKGISHTLGYRAGDLPYSTSLINIIGREVLPLIDQTHIQATQATNQVEKSTTSIPQCCQLVVGPHNLHRIPECRRESRGLKLDTS